MSDPNKIFVAGAGAVSPAGWGVAALADALSAGTALPVEPFKIPSGRSSLFSRRVPIPAPRPAVLMHPRLRRSSPVSQFAVSAALEALGNDSILVQQGQIRLGIICAVMTGPVIYSRRFYSEVLENPATASPLLFPETVYNAPASHVGAVLGTTSINYTLVGDESAFVQGLALAAEWLGDEVVDGCVVVASEEADWLTAVALRQFHRHAVLAEGAGAIYLRRTPAAVELTAVTDPQPYGRGHQRAKAWTAVRDQLAAHPAEMLWAITGGRMNLGGWSGPCIAIGPILGEGLAAMSSWACVAAVESLVSGRAKSGWVAVAGSNLQAIGAAFSVAGAAK